MRAPRIVSLICVSALVACGSGAPTTQPAARDQAAATACNYYLRCGQVGAGQKYVSSDDCLTQLKAYFNSTWPQDTCTSISSTGFNNCVTAINIADCNNLSDAVDVIFNKCTAANVCVTGGGG